MMHRCSNSHGNMVGPCTCGLYHSQSNSFSMLFSHADHMYPFNNSSSSNSASVDCTLSLGTPSTRLTNESEKRVHHHHHDQQRSGSRVSNFCWDILGSKTASHKSSRGNSNNNNNPGGSGGDSLLARRCANCDTTSTPLWRNGPRGPKSLCNACGIRFKKEERRATAAASTTTTANGGAPSGMMEPQHYNSWVHHSQPPQKMPFNEFMFIEDDHDVVRDSETALPFLSWRLNVTDRPGLVHDFTR